MSGVIDAEAAAAAIRERCTQLGACALCGSDLWDVSEYLWSPVEADPESGYAMPLSEAAMPMVALVCGACGHTHWLNAMKLGIVSPALPCEGEPQ